MPRTCHHHRVLDALLAVALAPAWGAFAAEAPVTLRMHVDRETAVYACGENARITVTAERNGQPVDAGEVTVRLIRDFRAEAGELTLKLDAGRAEFVRTLDEPGFLVAQARHGPAIADKPSVYALPDPKLAVAFSPERIQPALKEPDDFDAFWEAGRRSLASIPTDPLVVPVPNPYATAFKISVANIDGTRAWGFLAIPHDKEGPFPLLVSVPGANFRAPAVPGLDWVRKGVMRLWISVHPHDPQLPKEELDALEKTPAGNYTRLGAPDRERYYFRRAILGADRLIDYVCENHPWDEKHCVAFGHSQGGAFALFTAALNRHVTACVSEAPALCDHGGYTIGRCTGWPNLASYQEADLQEATLRMSGYFDGVFFARRIRVPTLVTVGFLDVACPPSSVYAAFNLVPGPKEIVHQIDRGHGLGQPAYATHRDGTWLPDALGLRAAATPAPTPTPESHGQP